MAQIWIQTQTVLDRINYRREEIIEASETLFELMPDVSRYEKIDAAVHNLRLLCENSANGLLLVDHDDIVILEHMSEENVNYRLAWTRRLTDRYSQAMNEPTEHASVIIPKKEWGFIIPATIIGVVFIIVASLLAGRVFL